MANSQLAYRLNSLHRLFDIPRTTAVSAIRAGNLKANKVGGRWYVSHDALTAWMQG